MKEAGRRSAARVRSTELMTDFASWQLSGPAKAATACGLFCAFSTSAQAIDFCCYIQHYLMQPYPPSLCATPNRPACSSNRCVHDRGAPGSPGGGGAVPGKALIKV